MFQATCPASAGIVISVMGAIRPLACSSKSLGVGEGQSRFRLPEHFERVGRGRLALRVEMTPHRIDLLGAGRAALEKQVAGHRKSGRRRRNGLNELAAS